VVVLRAWPRLGLAHAGMALYIGWAALSLTLADPPPAGGAPKLLGMAMLVALAIVTAEMVTRLGLARAIAWTVALTSLLVACAAMLGLVLAHSGHPTRLVGTWGDLVPGPYVRPQAAFVHPNLLASYCVFASGVVAWGRHTLPTWLQRVVQAALAVTVVLTFSRAIFGFVLAVLVRSARTSARRRLAWSFALAALIILAALTVFDLSLDPAHPLRTRILDGPGTRLRTWTSAWESFASHPLFGTGPGSRPARKLDEPFEAHFTPLNIAATLGLPALCGFLLILIGLWRARGRPTDPALWGMLAGLGLDALVSDVEDFRHLWVAFGLASASGRSDLAVASPERPRARATSA
jgi:O-antigen ligase